MHKRSPMHCVSNITAETLSRFREGHRAVTCADRGGGAFERMSDRTTHAERPAPGGLVAPERCEGGPPLRRYVGFRRTWLDRAVPLF
jgi:hypothetical protein